MKLNFKRLRSELPYLGYLTQQETIDSAVGRLKYYKKGSDLDWKPLEDAGIMQNIKQMRINAAASNLNSLRSSLAGAIQRVQELTKQLDDMDAELQATKDALEAMKKDRDTKVEDLHLRCETSNHFITREDKAIKRCPQCRLEAFDQQRTALRGAMVLVQRSAQRVDNAIPKEQREEMVAIVHGLIQVFGIADAALAEEQMDNNEADKKFGVATPKIGNWMTAMIGGSLVLYSIMGWFSSKMKSGDEK